MNAQMLDASCRLMGNVSQTKNALVVPSDEDATSVAQPWYTALASSLYSYRPQPGSREGSFDNHAMSAGALTGYAGV